MSIQDYYLEAFRSNGYYGRMVVQYIKTAYQNDPYRILVEVLLLVVLLWYYNQNRRNTGVQPIVLEEDEVEELIDDWIPEPLVPDSSDEEGPPLPDPPVIISQPGLRVKVASDPTREKLNLGSFDFLGLLNRESIKDRAIEALRKYGVGTCGPRGFYGTIDVHLELEERLANFMNSEGAIIYAQDYSTVSSAIPAFAKRGDTIVADEGSYLAVQVGQQISRSNLHFFKHNDMKDLERILRELRVSEVRKGKKLSRKFIIVEGIYLNYGDIAPLPELVKLKKEFKYRLIVDEHLSFGVLGKRGAGLADHFGLPSSSIDIMIGALSNSLGASGGFVCGTKEICEHQRLSGQAYTFSASLPAMLAVSAISALGILQEEPQMLERLHENIVLFQKTLISKNLLQYVDISGGESPENGSALVPIFLISLKTRNDEATLQEICDAALKDGILVSRAKFCPGQERDVGVKPCIRVALSAGLSKREVERAATILRDAIIKLKARKK